VPKWAPDAQDKAGVGIDLHMRTNAIQIKGVTADDLRAQRETGHQQGPRQEERGGQKMRPNAAKTFREPPTYIARDTRASWFRYAEIQKN